MLRTTGANRADESDRLKTLFAHNDRPARTPARFAARTALSNTRLARAQGSSRFVPDLVRKSKSRAFSQISPELDAEVEDGDDGVLHTEYYLTRGGDGVREYNGLELISRRPDVKGLMAKMARYAKAKGENRVGVLVCGPDMMVKAAREAAALLSGTNGVHFDFHSETFNF